MSVQLQANRQTPAQWALIGLGILAAGLFLAVPLAFIFIQAFQKGIAPVLENLVHPEMIHAVALTVFIALITVPVNMIFGVMLAWAVTRFSFPGKTVLLSCIDIPFAVSPVVAGLIYLLWYGANGPLAPWLDAAQVQILFAWPGMGAWVVTSIQALDFPAVMGFAVVVSLAYVLVNLVVDLLYLWIDPRIGRGGAE